MKSVTALQTILRHEGHFVTPRPALGLAARIFTALILALSSAASLAATAAVQTVHSFSSSGMFPVGALVKGNDGNYYGTTSQGGTGNNGLVFKLTPAGTLTTVHEFTGTDGKTPMAGLSKAADGTLYGTTESGGSNGLGTLFKIATDGTFTSVFSFDGTIGAYPRAAPLQAADGNFYGTAVQGGATGNGSVYKTTAAGVTTALFSFDGTVGKNPIGALIQGSDGNLYGTTESGGSGQGTIFKLTTSGVHTALFSFDGTRGSKPVAALFLASDGNYYGTTEAGGANSAGALYKMVISGATTTVTLVASLGGASGSAPKCALVQGTDGLLYGTTLGTVFRTTTAGTLSAIYAFPGTTGGSPQSGLMRADDGSFYGTTRDGGSADVGTVYHVLLPPAAPAGLSAVPSGDQITLNWGPTPGATSYNVYQGSSSGQQSATPAISGLTTTTGTVSDLSSGIYFFKVRAVSANGESDDSNEASASINVPGDFSFTPVTGASLDTLQTSASILISGLTDNSTLPITVSGDSGAAYSIDGGPFTTAAGTVSNGKHVQAQVRSSTTSNVTTHAAITIGKLTRSFDVSTFEADSTADAFSFTSVPNASPGSVQTSNVVVINGINVPVPISVTGNTGATYSINGGAFTASSGNVSNGSTVRVRVNAPATLGKNQTKATLTVGSQTATFVVGTQEDDSPNTYTFGSVSGAQPGSLRTSEVITVSGINVPVAIRLSDVTNAAYSVNGGDFRTSSSNVNDGDTVQIRLAAPSQPGATRSVDVTIGNKTATFLVAVAAAGSEEVSSETKGGGFDMAALLALTLLLALRRLTAATPAGNQNEY